MKKKFTLFLFSLLYVLGSWATMASVASITSEKYYSIQLPTVKTFINATTLKTSWMPTAFQFVASGNENGWYIKYGDQYLYQTTTAELQGSGSTSYIDLQASSFEWKIEKIESGTKTYFTFRPYSDPKSGNYLTAWSAGHEKPLCSWTLLENQSRWLLLDVSNFTLPSFAYLRQGDKSLYLNSSTSKITESKELFKFEATANQCGYYIKSGSNYVKAKTTEKGGSSVAAIETDASSYEWLIEYAYNNATDKYYCMIHSYESAADNNYLTAWDSSSGQTVTTWTGSDVNGRLLNYWFLELPTLEELINANLTFAEIKSMGYTGDDIAEFYKPTYLDKVGWPTTAAWTTFKTAINALNNADVVKTAYVTPYNTMCETFVTPSSGKFYRLTEYNGKTVYATGTNAVLSVATSISNPVSSVFYGSGSFGFVSYLNGHYVWNKSGVGATVHENPQLWSSYSFDHYDSHPVGAIRVKQSSNYWNSNGSAIGYTSAYPDKDNTAFYFEEVTSLPITMHEVDGAYYGTINFPVAVTIPSGLSAYSATASDGVMTLTKVVENGVLAKNTPVILYSKTDVTSLTVSNDTGSSPAGTNELSGTTAAISVTANQNYVLGNGASGTGEVGFYLFNGTVMPGFKAYLTSANASVRAFTFSFEDAEDAIRAIESENSGLEIYDISGRRVQKAQKGLYIVNGKKVMYK